MGSQTLELKWANHKANMTSELQELYLNDALLDVTIACGEFTLKAHKTVLSASSSFFRKLFINNPCKHPILIMTDVEFEDLKIIVEFMYQGEVHISRDKLTQFLKTADRLKVKGLTSIEDMNLNTPEHFEVDVDPQYSCGAWDDNNIRSQSQGTSQVEDNLNSSRKMTESVQKDTNQEMLKSVQSDTNIKLEHDAAQPANDDCMYWQSECFDQTSSSVLPDCSLPSTSSVSHQPSTSVSHQVSLPHQLSASSVSHQLSPSSVSHQLSTSSIPSEHGVPLNNEGFTFSESQTDSGIISQVQGESSGREIIPVSLYQSQDQSPIATSSKSYEATDSISSQPLQSGNSVNRGFIRPTVPFAVVRNSSHTGKGNMVTFEEMNYRKWNSSYDCMICKSTFLKEEDFKKHQKVHSKSKKFICEICNSCLSSESSLQRHLKMIHCGEKPFYCKICHKGFSSKSGFEYHKRIHTGEKPFWCKICLKKFPSKTGLQCHARIHNGEKPFSCKICHKRFSWKASLQCHESTHSGKKQFG